MKFLGGLGHGPGKNQLDFSGDMKSLATFCPIFHCCNVYSMAAPAPELEAKGARTNFRGAPRYGEREPIMGVWGFAPSEV